MKDKKAKKYLITSLILLIVSFILMGIAAFIYFKVNSILKDTIVEKMVLQENSISTFEDPPGGSQRHYFFYEILNSQDLVSGKASQPYLRERGPYIYDLKPKRMNVTFLQRSKSLTYNPIYYLKFRPDLSNGTEDDSFTFLNFPLFGAVNAINNINISDFLLFGLNLQLNAITNVFVNLTVNDLINGYTDSTTELIEKNQPGSLYNFDKFHFLTAKNFSNENFTISTGKEDISQIGQILKWNNLNKLTYWDTEIANRIKGSDGSYHGPFKTPNDTLYLFNSEFCRSFTMEYVKKSDVQGIETLEFHIPNNIFSNSTLNPDNEGFYRENYVGNGLFSQKRCTGQPILISQPHFLNAEEKFINAIKGMSKPDRSIHDSFLKIYPPLGISLAGTIGMQFNVQLKKSSKIELYQNISEIILPLVWFNDNVQIDKEYFDQIVFLDRILLLLLYLPLALVIVSGVLIWISTLIVMLFIIRLRKLSRMKLNERRAIRKNFLSIINQH